MRIYSFLFLSSLWVLSLGYAEAPTRKVLVDFSKESSADWISGEVPVHLVADADTPEIKLNFKSDNRQLTLTKAVSFNLEQHTSFRFRVGITRPQPLLEGSLAFKSGNGWYRKNFTLHDPGLAHLLFTKSEFSIEGRPSGWNRIEAIRLSFWPRSVGSTVFLPKSIEAFEDTLWVLNSESLSETGDETYTSRVSLRHMDRLLKGLGLPHAMVFADALNPAQRPTVVIIPYLPKLPTHLYQTFSQWQSQGTAFIVFESAHQGFARKLGVDLGPALNSSTVGQFDHLKLQRPKGSSLPAKIYQHAWSFRTIRPLTGSKVTSTWTNAMGSDLQEPGSIESEKAVWLNVAWRSGDIEAKKIWLTEWIGTRAPELLEEALLFYRETRSPDAFEERVGKIEAGEAAAHHLKSMAEREFGYALRVNSASNIHELRKFQKSDQLMQRAFASSQKPWSAELKGIWDQNGTGFYVGSWDKTCAELKAAGFNAVFPNMASAGRAHYPSRYIPPSKSFEKYGDQLRAFTSAAHKHGLQAHAWKICWKLNTRLPAFEEKMRREGRLMEDVNGKTIPWLSISHPANVQFEIDSLLEMARHAPIDGIHLDYMRYPGREADYGPAAREAFQKQMGRTFPNWPAEVVGPLKSTYQVFRQQEIHRAMRQISTAVKQEFPNLKLSVAVWGAWPDCADAQGQDWPVWCKEGWVDWIIPMNYTDNPDQFAGWLDIQRAQPGVAERLIPGLGLISSNAELSPAQLLTQLDLVKQRNLPGAIIYRLDSSLESRLFPYLKIWK